METGFYSADDWILLQGLTREQILTWADKAREQETWQEVVPGIDSLALKYDPASETATSAEAKAAELLQIAPVDLASGLLCEDLPVCYDTEFGPDQEMVADHLDIAVRDLPEWHMARDYEVAMIGFLPGFAYLQAATGDTGVPRLETPRARVAAGSVGIIGAQCGLYPMDGPGGWPLIGRTAARLFDPARSEPALLKPGQKIRFKAVSRGEYDSLVRS